MPTPTVGTLPGNYWSLKQEEVGGEWADPPTRGRGCPNMPKPQPTAPPFTSIDDPAFWSSYVKVLLAPDLKSGAYGS